jgi:DNA ligase-associated metallophosphoesterase
MLEFTTQAGPILFDAGKVAVLPDSRTLLVADLHFEKGSYLQAIGGNPLPGYDTPDTLERLAGLISALKPDHVAALGDSFHDVAAGARMHPDDYAKTQEIVDGVPRFTWILGNHDPDIPAGLPGDQEDHLEEGGFLLTHLPTPPFAENGVNVCGHLHPKVRVRTRRSARRFPCFAVCQSRIILPSFGTFTGGLDVEDPAIADELPGERAYFAVTGGTLTPVSG